MCRFIDKMFTKYGSLSDGMVCLRDGLVPGAAVIQLDGLDHGAPVFDLTAHRVYRPGTLFEALIHAVLELPPDYATLAR